MMVTIRKIMKMPKSKCIPLVEFFIKGFFIMEMDNLYVSEFTHPPCEIKSKTLLRSSISQGKFMRSSRLQRD